jgi:hypothetical protein
MAYAQRISSLVLSLRKKEKIKVRQPLKKMLIPILNDDFEKQVDGVKDLILAEVNVKEIEYVSGAGNITSSSNVGISGANSRTLSCWVYFTSKTIQSLMCIGVNGAGTGWGIETSSTIFSLSKGNSGTVTTITYNTGQWYNVVYVGQNLSANSLTISLYINGSLQYSGTDTSINTTNSTLKIGTSNSGSLAFNGRISQAKVYNKALSAREIKKNYDGFKSKFGL